MRDLDRAIAALARSQHGAWSRSQAVAAGASGSAIDRRIRNGAWLRLDGGVYASPASPPSFERSVMAAVLAESWAVASHRSAAVLHGLVGFSRGRPEVTVRPDAHARGRLATVHRGVDVKHGIVQGIPCVTLDQVFIDLAQVAPARVARALARAADSRPALLGAVRDRYCALAPRGGRNLRALRSALDRFGVDGGWDESELERRMRRLFSRVDLPEIVWQAPFPGRQPGLRRVDGVVPAWKVVIEGDGRAWHTRVDDFERDRRRDQETAAAGYVTLRFSYHQITQEPAWCLTTLREVGARRRSVA